MRGRGGSCTGERKRAGAGRTSSLRRGAGIGRGGSFRDENAAGPVSVHVKQVILLCHKVMMKSIFIARNLLVILSRNFLVV